MEEEEQEEQLPKAVAESSCREVARCFTGTPLPPPPKTFVTDGCSEFIYRIRNASFKNNCTI
jgi:hypothetical protein